MRKDPIVADLDGRNMARYTTIPFGYPSLTIMSPAMETDFGLIPAQSLTINGGGIEALVLMLIEAGLCSRPTLLLNPGTEPVEVTQ